MTWSFYDPATGIFWGRTYSGPDFSLDANTPDGMAAICGDHDHRTRKVNLATGEVEDYTPPPPTAEQIAAALRVESLAKIAALEAAQPRAIREAVLTGDKARLQSIDIQIQTLRGDLA